LDTVIILKPLKDTNLIPSAFEPE